MISVNIELESIYLHVIWLNAADEKRVAPEIEE